MTIEFGTVLPRRSRLPDAGILHGICVKFVFQLSSVASSSRFRYLLKETMPIRDLTFPFLGFAIHTCPLRSTFVPYGVPEEDAMFV